MRYLRAFVHGGLLLSEHFASSTSPSLCPRGVVLCGRQTRKGQHESLYGRQGLFGHCDLSSPAH